MLSNFRVVLVFIVVPVVWWVKYWLIFTTLVTDLIFISVAGGFGQLPSVFFIGLVTLDSLLIGVTGLVASMIIISLDLSKIQKSFEPKTAEEGPEKWVKEMLSLAVATRIFARDNGQVASRMCLTSI